MADVCERCGLTKPLSVTWLWACCGDGPGLMGQIKQETLDCKNRQLEQHRDRIRALESELTSARTTIADLSYQLGKSQGEAEGHRLVRVGLEVELAEMRKREEWIPVAERLPPGGRVVFAFDAMCSRPLLVWRAHDGSCWFPSEGLARSMDVDITHWLPLPASPRPEPEHRDDGKSG